MLLTLLLVGQIERAEAQPLVEWLTVALRSAAQHHFSDLTRALEAASRTNTIPDLVVIVQSQPDEFSPSEIARLFAFAPLARVVVAYGAWCESDGRTRNAWPLAVRISLPHAAARIEREWQLLNEARGLEPLPLSASREEVFAADHRPFQRASSRATAASSQIVLIASPDPAYRRFLNELLATAGHSIYVGARPAPDSPPTAILFDADPWDAARVDQVRSLRQQHPSAKIIALMSSLHTPHEAELLAAGAFSVRPKLGDQTAMVSTF